MSERVLFTSREKKALIGELGGCCAKCGFREDLALHHRLAVSDGGTNDIGNIVPLCGHCHQEWHRIESPNLNFDEWLLLPPSALIVIALLSGQDSMTKEFRAVLEESRNAIRQVYLSMPDFFDRKKNVESR